MSRGLPLDVRVANCAGCGCLVLSVRELRRLGRDHGIQGRLAGRIHGRPYCHGCLEVSPAGVSGLAGGMATDHGSPSPWHENTTRAAEDGPR